MDDDVITPILEYYGGENLPYFGGRWKTIRCMFHEERNASARSNGSGFICNACGMSGDGVRLVQQKEVLGYAAAVSFIKERIGANYQALREPTPNRRKRRDSLLEGTRTVEGDSNLFQVGLRKRASRI